jgi:hypothetical protein
VLKVSAESVAERGAVLNDRAENAHGAGRELLESGALSRDSILDDAVGHLQPRRLRRGGKPAIDVETRAAVDSESILRDARGSQVEATEAGECVSES